MHSRIFYRLDLVADLLGLSNLLPLVAFCCITFVRANAQTNNASYSTNQIEEVEVQNGSIRPAGQVDAEVKLPAIKAGDSLEHVLVALGEPNIDCPLQNGKRVLFYEAGEIHFTDNKVTTFSMLTTEELIKKREETRQRRLWQERQRRLHQSTMANLMKTNLERYNKKVAKREAQLKKDEKRLVKRIREERSSIERNEIALSVDDNADMIAENSKRTTSGSGMRRRHHEEWLSSATDNYSKYIKELKAVYAELDEIEEKRNRMIRHGY